MRTCDAELSRIAGSHYGFLIADLVLRDTVADFVEGSSDEDELAIALRQHRIAYEGYVSRLREYLRAQLRARRATAADA